MSDMFHSFFLDGLTSCSLCRPQTSSPMAVTRPSILGNFPFIASCLLVYIFQVISLKSIYIQPELLMKNHQHPLMWASLPHWTVHSLTYKWLQMDSCPSVTLCLHWSTWRLIHQGLVYIHITWEQQSGLKFSEAKPPFFFHITFLGKVHQRNVFITNRKIDEWVNISYFPEIKQWAKLPMLQTHSSLHPIIPLL